MTILEEVRHSLIIIKYDPDLRGRPDDDEASLPGMRDAAKEAAVLLIGNR
jgi:hypothetical protein